MPPRVRPTEPANTLLYAPANLAAPETTPDVEDIKRSVECYSTNTFNDRQAQAFNNSFEKRLTLLWGPPGTGKTSTLAATILGWLEYAWTNGRSMTVGVGSSNWNAIGNVLSSVVELLEERRANTGEPTLNTRVIRFRGEHSSATTLAGVEDCVRGSDEAAELANSLEEGNTTPECLIIGSTWTQLSKQSGATGESKPRARWFDLLVIDEASQVKVSMAAGYFLLLKESGHVVLSGDPKQLGPIYKYDVEELASEDSLYDCVFTYMQHRHGLTPVALNENYRTNDEIAIWPRIRFYNNDFQAMEPDKRLALSLPDSKPILWPPELLWHDIYLEILDPSYPVVVVTYPESPYTLSNPFEASLTACLSSLYQLADGGGRESDDPYWQTFWKHKLGIITPHRAQMARIRTLLSSKAGFPSAPIPIVDTVDRFQGQERDFIISSYTVADKDFAASEDSFILSSRRFNVSLTRAKTKFVLLISEALLRYLPTDKRVAEDASHLQRFVEAHCGLNARGVVVPTDSGTMICDIRRPEI